MAHCKALSTFFIDAALNSDYSLTPVRPADKYTLKSFGIDLLN
jgi:hypothetical protein